MVSSFQAVDRPGTARLGAGNVELNVDRARYVEL